MHGMASPRSTRTGATGLDRRVGQPAPDLYAGRFDSARNGSSQASGPVDRPLERPAARPAVGADDECQGQGTGLQLTREFALDPATSHLVCTQTMTNISDRPVSTCHWSRTMSTGAGICLIPLTPSRFPRAIDVRPGAVMTSSPRTPTSACATGRGDPRAPARPKLGSTRPPAGSATSRATT